MFSYTAQPEKEGCVKMLSSKKQRRENPALFFCLLALGNRTHGAGTSAGTAVDAGAGVDDEVVVALGDGAHGAAVNTGTAADASVTDNIGHDMYTSIKMVSSFYHKF